MRYDYPKFNTDIKEIVRQIRQDDIKFDLIVGIARGGAIPAIRLSHVLDVPCKILNWQTRDGDLYQDRNVAQQIATSVLLHSKKILFVDDMVDSGETFITLLAFMRSILSEDMMANIKKCALIFNVEQQIKLDYYSFEIRRSVYPDWINFWWEEK